MASAVVIQVRDLDETLGHSVWADDGVGADGDGDGLTDVQESDGWTTLNGTFLTDPEDSDTDDDGLTDGDEAGRYDADESDGVESLIFVGRSDPTSWDTDDDGLDDATEEEGGSDPWAEDSDRDDVVDFAEIEYGSDPMSPNADGDHLDDAAEIEGETDPYVYDLTRTEAATALIAGALTAQSSRVARAVFKLPASQMDSWWFLAGSLASGVIPASDLRKVATNVGSMQWRAAATSLASVVPVLGTASRALTTIAKFAARGDAAARAAVQLLTVLPTLDDQDVADGVLLVQKVAPGDAQLGLDSEVAGTTAPEPLATSRPVSLDPSINDRKDQIVEDLDEQGYSDIRVNQAQVDGEGILVGANRPDVQALAPDGKRHHYVIDPAGSSRGTAHLVRLIVNDEDADVHLVEVG